MSAASALLSVEQLSRHFGGITALDAVSFDVEAGTVCGLIGPNGAGKTTLINVVSGIIPPTSGSVRLDGQSITGKPPHVIAALGVGRTFQNIRLFNDLSVIENVMLGHYLWQRDTILEAVLRLPRSRKAERSARETAHDLLRDLRMDHLADAKAGALSYGDQRRVEIARALSLEPRLLLLDEPAAGMNDTETDQLAGFLIELRERGLSMLVIEHDMPFIMRLSNKVVVLNFGRKIAEGTPDEVRRDQRVIDAYLGAEH